MARKNKQRRSRANFLSATQRVRPLLPLLSPLGYVGLVRAPASQIDGDRRAYHPLGDFRPAFSTKRAAARLVAKEPIGRAVRRFNAQTKATIAFADPSKVMVCVRRQVRRRVLNAAGVGGMKVFRPKHRKGFSNIRC